MSARAASLSTCLVTYRFDGVGWGGLGKSIFEIAKQMCLDQVLFCKKAILEQ